MNAIILAAGRGSRMKSYTDEMPKCLVSVRGKTLLQRQIDSLHASGVSKIAVVSGYRRECLPLEGMTEFFNPRWRETNMVSSLACAAQWLRQDSCIVSYSDIFYPPDAVVKLVENTAPISITYDSEWLELWSNRFSDPLSDAETFRIDENGYVVEIGGKANSVSEIQGQYMGLLKITPDGWSEIERVRQALSSFERDCLQMTKLLQLVIAQNGIAVKGTEFSGTWGEVDSPDDLDFYSKQSG